MEFNFTYKCCNKTIKWKGTKKSYNRKVKENRKCQTCSKIKNNNDKIFFKEDNKGKNRKFIKFICINCNEEKEIRYDSFITKKRNLCNKCSPLLNNHIFTKTHGISNHPIYRTWTCMKNRCNNPKYENYHRYGGRGITICKDWDDIINFYEWSLKNGWKEKLEIDRINNNGNYEPSNCRWITHLQNCNNR